MKIEIVAEHIVRILAQELALDAEILMHDPLTLRPSLTEQKIYVYPTTSKITPITRSSKEYQFDLVIIILQQGKENNNINMEIAQQIQSLFTQYEDRITHLIFNLKKQEEDTVPFDATAFQQTSVNSAFVPIRAILWN